ncbi:carbon-nitrogen hydrolase [Sordaria brevicollis]|uniref:Carbon-nitrogen hydrolase n=1 Tax=Sordaria brevicollis TaxID=83679 RepID=A0AAE0PP60_SORBR|nr:carbon-nitrogen hydrolase [Sordaria brevicollis]
MRIGCLQFAPQVGDVSNNLSRADAILAKANQRELEDLDLLVLPEMAFSGYNFKTSDEIQPFLEPSGSGISALWARTNALKYDCTVAVGYPEKVGSSGSPRGSTPEYYNSLLVVNGDGETVANYRKSFLYYTDQTWALEGGGFYGGRMEGFGNVAMGICMDINPYKFEAPWHKFEFAFHVLEVKANLVILSMAWLTHEDPSTFTPAAHEPDLATLTYWLQRFEPVIRDESDEELIVVFCNRCGMEDDVLYAGTSAVIGIKNGEVFVYGLLGRGSKELLVVDTDSPPFGKLVNRPDAASESNEEQQPQTTPGNTTGNPASPSQANTNSPYSPVRTHTQSEAAVQAAASNRHIGGNRRSPAEDRRRPTLNIPTKPSRFVADEEEDCSDSCAEEDYAGCQGNCGGCDGHAYVGWAEAVESPVYPTPTVMAMRPKLPNYKSARTLPPITTKRLPSGVKPGNYFTSRDLCTPPITPYEDAQLSAACRAPLPFSPAVNTPVEADWPVSARTDFHRQPSHTPPSRPASRSTHKSGARSRNPSRTRGPEVISPTTSHHSYQSARTGPTERDPRRARYEGEREHELGEQCMGRAAARKPAKTGFDDLFSMIPIAASPSVFKTSFSEAEVMNNPHQQQRTAQPVHMRLREEPPPLVASRQRPVFERVPSRLRSTSASNPKVPPSFNYPPPPVPQTPQYTPSSYSSNSRSSSRSRQPSYTRRGSEQRTVPSTPSTASPTTPHYYQQHHVLPPTTYGGSGYAQQKLMIHDDEPEAFYGRGPVTPVTPVTPGGGWVSGRDNRGRKVSATQQPQPSKRTHSVDPHRREPAAPVLNGRSGGGAMVNGRYYPPDLLSPVSV